MQTYIVSKTVKITHSYEVEAVNSESAKLLVEDNPDMESVEQYEEQIRVKPVIAKQ